MCPIAVPSNIHYKLSIITKEMVERKKAKNLA